MRDFFRISALWVLCLGIAAASVTSAVARTAAHGQYSVVICGIDGVVQITLDAQGNPVAPMHPCPDCIVVLSAALPAASDPPFVAFTVSDIVPGTRATAVIAARVPPGLARGPPRLV